MIDADAEHEANEESLAQGELAADESFAALGLKQEVLDAIEEMGWAAPTPVQVRCLGPASEGRDLIVQSRTGTGKTGAFGIPIVDRIAEAGRGVQAVILAPTRELALQSAKEIGKLGKGLGIRTAAIYGGAPMEKQVDEIRRGAEIISGTPGRVLDHIKRGTLDVKNLRVLVLDEADEMLSMGFAKELNAIMKELPSKRQNFLLSATTEGPVKRMAERHLRAPELIELSGDAVGALGVSHFVYLVSGVARAKDLVRIIEIEDPENAIIFCNTKAETEAIARALTQAGYEADFLSGDLSQREREKVMERTRRGEIRVLVATDVAARGIDVSHLTHVINVELPTQLEQYVHRTGRTGRAGRTGTAISLVAPPELGSLYYLRLQYKIFPVERSLPTEGEAESRAELDRLELLIAGTRAIDRPIDRAIAKRLLAHPDREAILARLIASFFFAESGDVDELAAAARRAGASRSEESRAKPKKSSRENDADEDDDEDEVTLYLNLGKRDGLKASEIAQWLLETTKIERTALKRVRTKEKHSFVRLDEDVAEDVLAALAEADYKGKAVVAERAKAR